MPLTFLDWSTTWRGNRQTMIGYETPPGWLDRGFEVSLTEAEEPTS